MKKFHPFFTIGTVGIISAACLHLILSWGLSLKTVNTTFITIYPVFLTFLILGVVFTSKKQKASK